MCTTHAGTTDWSTLVAQINSQASEADSKAIFKLQHEYANRLESRQGIAYFDLENLETMKPSLFRMWFGFYPPQFARILAEAGCTKRQLGMFLLKMRNNMPNQNIGSLFSCGDTLVGEEIQLAVRLMLRNIVPRYLEQTRDQLLQHVDPTTQLLFDVEPGQLSTGWDGSYRFMERSTNFNVQTDSFSTHKNANIYKVRSIPFS